MVGKGGASGGGLARQVGLAVGGVVSAASAAFLVLVIGLYWADLRAERAAAANQVSALLHAALENAMLKRDLDGLEGIVTRLGGQPGIRAVAILNPAREVRFASDPALIDRVMADVPLEPRVVEARGADGRPLLRGILPVPNQEACTGCHGAVADTPINGVLVIDHEADSLPVKAGRGALVLVGLGAVVLVLAIALLIVVLRRLVLAPVAALAAASGRLAGGDLTARVGAIGSGDELARLGTAFDAMAASLERHTTRLRAQEAFLQGLIDGLPDGLRVIGPDYRILAANRAYRDQLGLDAAATVVGTPCYRSSHGREAPCEVAHVTCPLHALAEAAPGSRLKAAHLHVRGDGSAFAAEISAAVVMAPGPDGGPPLRLVVETVRDLDGAVELSHAQRLSEVAELATGVMHEIRNPLVAIRLALRGILRGAGTAEGTGAGALVAASDMDLGRYLHLMDEQVDACLTAAERLLNLAHLPDEGPGPVDLAAALGDAEALLRYEARVGGVRVRLDGPPPGTCVLATPAEVRMVAINLMQNAFHAMPGGGSLDIVAAVDAAAGMAEIRFADRGPGIPPDILARVFQPFVSRRADGVEGTGMGLAICKAIVETYGGSITVDSRPGEGTTFRIRLPLAVAADGR